MALLKIVKGHVVSIHAMKAYKGNRGIAPLMLNLDTRCGCEVNLRPCRLTGTCCMGGWVGPVHDFGL